MDQRIVTGEDIVLSLLVKPFSSQSLAERKISIQEGRPQPRLEVKTKDRVFQQSFTVRKIGYVAVKVRLAIFIGLVCFFAIFFQNHGQKQDILICTFSCLIAKKESAKSCMEAYKVWRTFDITIITDIVFSRARREEIQQHNEHVRQNRDILKIISEAVLFLAKQEVPCGGYDESSSSLKKRQL